MTEPTNVDDNDLNTNIDTMLSEAIKFDAEGTAYPDFMQLKERLVIYIVNRDHQVWNHAYKLGKESK